MIHGWYLNIIYSATNIIALLKRLTIEKMSELETGIGKSGQKLKWRNIIRTNLLIEIEVEKGEDSVARLYQNVGVLRGDC